MSQSKIMKSGKNYLLEKGTNMSYMLYVTQTVVGYVD